DDGRNFTPLSGSGAALCCDGNKTRALHPRRTRRPYEGALSPRRPVGSALERRLLLSYLMADNAVERQVHMDHCSLAHHPFDGEIAAMQLRQMLRNRQAEAGASMPARE